MFTNYYPKTKILKLLTEKEEIDGIEVLKKSIKLHLPHKANSYIIISKVLQELYADGLIESNTKPEIKDIGSHPFQITAKGLEELQKRKEHLFIFWLPTAISLLALLVSVSSVLSDVVKLLITARAQ